MIRREKDREREIFLHWRSITPWYSRYEAHTLTTLTTVLLLDSVCTICIYVSNVIKVCHFPSQHHRHHLLPISDTSSGLLWAEVEANQDSWKSISRTMSQLNSAMRVSASEGANLPGSKLKTQGIADFGHSWYQNAATLQFFWYPIWTHTHLMCGFKRGCKQQKHQGVKACQVFVLFCFFWSWSF
jgi:hypothetical protein